MRIVVQRQPIHKSVLTRFVSTEGGFHDFLCPLVIIHICSAGDLFDRFVSGIVPHICLVSAVHISIEIRVHVTATAPVVISHTKVIYRPRFFVTVFRSQVCHRGYALEGHVFYPLRHFLYGSASHVAVDISLTAQLTAQLEEFVRSEAVVFYYAAPVGVDDFLSSFFRSDAVFPVIFVSEASARPAKYRDTDLF